MKTPYVMFIKTMFEGTLSAMDKIVSTIVSLGIPGLILFVAIEATGYAGAAALTTALAALGPGGMIGGLITLGLTSVMSGAIAEFGFSTIFKAVVGELAKRGESIHDIKAKIDKYPISHSLKLRLYEDLSKFG